MCIKPLYLSGLRSKCRQLSNFDFVLVSSSEQNSTNQTLLKTNDEWEILCSSAGYPSFGNIGLFVVR